MKLTKTKLEKIKFAESEPKPFKKSFGSDALILIYLYWPRFFYFIFICILLTCRKARVALIHKASNYSDMFPEMPSITVRLNCSF